jgi:hypothetical protein
LVIPHPTPATPTPKLPSKFSRFLICPNRQVALYLRTIALHGLAAINRRDIVGMLAATFRVPKSTFRQLFNKGRQTAAVAAFHHRSPQNSDAKTRPSEMASDSSQNNDVSNVSSKPRKSEAAPAQFEVVKRYPSRGPLRQYRLASATSFTCSRCQQQRTAKLVATRDKKWDDLLCNGCYGFTLSKQ